MEWYVVLALILVVPVILFPVVLIWFLNIKGIREMAGERRVVMTRLIKKWGRLGALGVPAAAFYGFFIWFFLGRFGWPAALATALVLPLVMAIPFLIWVSAVSGLSQVLLLRLRRRAGARRTAVSVTAPENR